MSLYPLWNSLRIAAISSVVVFFLGIFLAYYVSKLPKWLKGIIDVIFTLPLVLPPTVCGYLLLLVFGKNYPVGQALDSIGISFVMTWQGGVLASIFVAFPLMYRTVRASFESFNENLAYAGKTLGLSNTYIFWRIRIPARQSGIIAGIVLSFARALGEYGATSMLIGYIPTKTATISTTVYHFWQNNDSKQALIWVLINIVLSAAMLLTVNLVENRGRRKVK
ncbi:MAG: molybdate ABC transporter permease subunit [Bacilli bacterium]|nr:molybdate ABC transporter permease subunit [Bacilli bacterium]